MRCLLVLLALVALACGSSPRPSGAQGAAANCAAPGKFESAICADAELMDRERSMAPLLAAASVDALGTGPSRQQAEQQKWLKGRGETCSREPIRSCLLDWYKSRLRELAVAALLRVPDAALAELRRQEAGMARRYEALYRYATIEDDAERAAVVASLIAPALGKLQRAEWAADQLKDVPDPRTAAASDGAFSLVFALAASGRYERVPCSALLRRPGLLKILSARFGR
jgi:uncharacterized protein